MTIASRTAQNLLKINAIKLSPDQPFTWSSGLKSPIYCDNRIVLSYPDIRSSIIKSFAEKASAFEPFDLVAGVATAGIAHGALLAEALKLPFAYVRSKAKGHGRQNQIEGKITGQERVLVIEDLISTGGSALKAIEALRAEGCTIVGTLAIFSYGFETAKQAFQEANCSFDTLSNYEVLIKEAISSGYISQEQESTLKEWSHNPKAWSTQRQ